MSLAAVTSNGNALQFVPHKTPAICLAAVKHSGLALEFVPTNIRDNLHNGTRRVKVQLLDENKYLGDSAADVQQNGTGC